MAKKIYLLRLTSRIEGWGEEDEINVEIMLSEGAFQDLEHADAAAGELAARYYGHAKERYDENKAYLMGYPNPKLSVEQIEIFIGGENRIINRYRVIDDYTYSGSKLVDIVETEIMD
jgi:hypothetical protein